MVYNAVTKISLFDKTTNPPEEGGFVNGYNTIQLKFIANGYAVHIASAVGVFHR